MAEPRENASDLGSRLQDLRKALGWTQDDLAHDVGRRSNTVSEWERGVRSPSRRVLADLCRKHGWPIAMFEPGGPMPRDVVNRPLTGRVREEVTSPKPRRAGAALRYYNEVWTLLNIAAGKGESVSAQFMLDSLNGLWRQVLAEAPELGEPAVPPPV